MYVKNTHFVKHKMYSGGPFCEIFLISVNILICDSVGYPWFPGDGG